MERNTTQAQMHSNIEIEIHDPLVWAMVTFNTKRKDGYIGCFTLHTKKDYNSLEYKAPNAFCINEDFITAKVVNNYIKEYQNSELLFPKAP